VICPSGCFVAAGSRDFACARDEAGPQRAIAQRVAPTGWCDISLIRATGCDRSPNPLTDISIAV